MEVKLPSQPLTVKRDQHTLKVWTDLVDAVS